MMRETGVVGLFMVVFLNARDGFGSVRAWQAVAVFALLLALPIALIVGAFALVLSLL